MWKEVVAIDGPAGVGKSTVARLVAKALRFTFLNTGDMYRALTWQALKEGVPVRDAGEVSRFLRRRPGWEVRLHDGSMKIYMGGREMGRELRTERVSKAVPLAASVPAVRRWMRRAQGAIARRGRVVLEGRDTTTHVAPQAQVKIYLDAPVEERALRRFRQLAAVDVRVKRANIERSVRMRDRRERERHILPVRHTPGTFVLDTTHLTLHEVARKVLELYARSRRKA